MGCNHGTLISEKQDEDEDETSAFVFAEMGSIYVPLLIFEACLMWYFLKIVSSLVSFIFSLIINQIIIPRPTINSLAALKSFNSGKTIL